VTRERNRNVMGLVKRVAFRVVAVVLVVINPRAAFAPTTTRGASSAPTDVAVPTTRPLATGSFTANAT
jgi:hypothetical protein